MPEGERYDIEPGSGKHGPIRTYRRVIKTPEQIRQALIDKGIDPERPWKGVTIPSTHGLSPSIAKGVKKQSKKREIGDYQGALQETAQESGIGMPKLYNYSNIIRMAAMTMHNSSEAEGQWNLDNWWAWLQAGRDIGSLTMDDEEIEDKFLIDPSGYNKIWNWVREYEATTGIKLEPNYTINLRGGLQRGPITGSRTHVAREIFEDPTIGYPESGRDILIDPNSPRYRNR